MRILLNILGALLVLVGVLVGGTFFLQGIGVLPGSFMTGQTRWAVYGGLCVVLGLLLLTRANGRRP